MQLKPKMPQANTVNSRRRLMAASCALLSAGAARSQDASVAPASSGLLEDWSADSALAYYQEDGRIQAIEPVVNISKAFADGEILNFNATFDALSGASPNGALPSHSPQTFTGPSGKKTHAYTIAPGQLPSDPHYSDARFAAGVHWTTPLSRVDELIIGGKFSVEDDFVSGTLDASIAHDFNQKNTTLSFGLYSEYDSLHPIGNTPVPGGDVASLVRTGGKNKEGVGALLGITQVMTRTWLTELNLSVDRFTGYLNDPYKITSIIDSAGNTTGYDYESRPNQRTRKSAYSENRVAWSSQLSSVLSLRYMSDNWAVRSDTAQLHLRWSWANREQYIEPTIRWYRQTAADFYTPFIRDTATQSSSFESADSRLGAFHALTYGVKYAHRLPGLGNRAESEFSVRAEYYQQRFNEQIPVPAGLQGLDLYPGLKAVLVQLGYRF
jgi:Protein of unknown function (DUF3570)